MKNSATILTHLRFDRPTVKQNPPSGRRPKSIISIREVRIARRIKHKKSGPSIQGTLTPRTACAQYQQFETLLRTANEEGASCMLMMLDAALKTEINRRIREGAAHGK